MMNKEKKADNEELGTLSDEELSIYWDEHDASSFLETGDFEEVSIAENKSVCNYCGNSKVRTRIIDLPILDGSFLLNDIEVTYCPACKRSFINSDELEDVAKHLKAFSGRIDYDNLKRVIDKGLRDYEKRWDETENERKVVSIYFPSQTMGPKKAQVSLKASDPIYPKLKSLTSEEVRDTLGIQYFEDLEREARAQKRTISAYIKCSLEDYYERVEDSGFEDSRTARIIKLHPRTAGTGERSQVISLAAESDRQATGIGFSDEDESFIGVLTFDYEKLIHYLDVKKNDAGTGCFRITIEFDDEESAFAQQVRVENDRIAFMEGVRDKRKHIVGISLEEHGERLEQ